MIIIHADSEGLANELNTYVESGKDVFMLIYMVGCGPCNATRPEWTKLEDALKHKYRHNNNLVIASVDSNIIGSVKHTGEVIGFPTILYLSHNGTTREQFEASSIRDKRRDVVCFINWVNSHVKEDNKRQTNTRRQSNKKRQTNTRRQKSNTRKNKTKYY